MSSLLHINNLQGWYGATQVLFGVNLDIREGEVVALLGRNGMGKTSTILAIMAMMPKRNGEILFGGNNIMPLKSYEIAQSGVGLVAEGRRCFGRLTVQENLIAVVRPGYWDISKVFELFPKLGERKTQKADTLSGGEQQMLSIGRALVTNPRLLILDEATEGLAPVVRQEIWAAILSLKQNGLSILIVDKSLRDLLSISDHCVILEKGATCWLGQPFMLTEEITTLYLGV